MAIPNIKFTNGAITYRQGTDAQISLFLKDAAQAPVNVSGWSIRFVMKKDYASAPILVDLAVNSGITIIGNEIQIVFSKTCFKGVLKEQSIAGVYQIDGTDTNGRTQVLLDGTITVLKDLIP